jgi:histidinol-phosphate aminotransferase
MVSRTFSKVYGLAGLRLGYAIAHPDLIRKISKYQMGPHD